MLFRQRVRTAPPRSASSDIEAAEYSLVALPWKGSPCMVKGRTLSDIQIQALGNFSLIETDEYKWSRAPGQKSKWSELLRYAETNVKVCKAWLVSPTYDEIFDAVGKGTFNAEAKRQIEHVNGLLGEMKAGPARQELEEIRDSLILSWEMILPDDFMAGAVACALRINETDIKKVTEDMLYGAAVLAERGHGAPHDYIHGMFTQFNIRDIDTRAWIVFDERTEKAREEARERRGA